MYITLANFHNIFLLIQNEPKKDTLLSVEPGLIIWTIVIFIILVLILKKYAWGPMLKSLNEREQKIKDSIDKAEYLKQEAEKMLAEHRLMLSKADEESRRIINESKEMAEKLRNDFLTKTNTDAHNLIQQAKSEIEREKISALNTLKDEIANLAVQAASKIIDENLNPDKQKQIVEGFINQIPKN
jgi:F-type H+-transporting ATPase subunit b